MKIHTDTLTTDHLRAAAKTARVEMEYTTHGSRSRARAFNISLTGESRRRPQGGDTGAGTGYAATWDQWGVFLAALFAVDDNMTCWAYDNAENFADKTGDRFAQSSAFPADYHGDHTFRWNGMESACNKCSAVQRR